MDENKIAISFGRWLATLCIFDGNNKRWLYCGNIKYYSTEEIFDVFIKEYGTSKETIPVDRIRVPIIRSVEDDEKLTLIIEDKVDQINELLHHKSIVVRAGLLFFTFQDVENEEIIFETLSVISEPNYEIKIKILDKIIEKLIAYKS